MEYHCLNPALGEFQLNLVVLVKVKVYVSLGSDQWGRGAPLEVKLGKTGSCSRVAEEEFVAYIYISSRLPG